MEQTRELFNVKEIGFGIQSYNLVVQNNDNLKTRSHKGETLLWWQNMAPY